MKYLEIILNIEWQETSVDPLQEVVLHDHIS